MKKRNLKIAYRSVSELIPYVNNARTHSDEQVLRLASSIKEFGFTNPILVDGENGVIAGHGRLLAAKKLGLDKVPTIELADLTETQKKAYILADNKLALDAGWDTDILKVELGELKALDFDLDIIGFSDSELNSIIKETRACQPFGTNSGGLKDRFIVSPFSVLDTRTADWQARKKRWNELIGDNTESREDMQPSRFVFKDTSLLDATLAELINYWFLPKASIDEPNRTFDPFAGDTVFGFVSAYMGNIFTGIELRQEQVDLNNKRLGSLTGEYICDDGQNVANHLAENSQDLLFSCPPYFNLEKYSDLPNDASNQDYKGFITILKNALLGALKCLKENRFAVIVMSNVRDTKTGFYHDICSDIRAIMETGGGQSI